MTVVGVGGDRLTCGGIAAVARGEAGVRLTEAGRARAGASMEYADRVARHRPLYGRSTGVGANRSVPVAGSGNEHVLAILRSHATSAGNPRSPERVRALLLVRLNQLAAGGSGVAPAVLDGLAAMLAADALPPVRELGSIGTGDLSALATTALALLGEVPTSRPLPGPTLFGVADGVGFISSNAGALADAALAVDELTEAARAAVVIAGLTAAVVAANSEAWSPVVELATPFAGARTVCSWLRGLSTGLPPARIQDPFGLRTLPQVHGPVLDALTAARDTVEALVNAPTENPLVVPAVDAVAHHGGFQQAYLQLALDTVRLAVARGGQLIPARLALLVDPAFTGLEPFLSDGSAGASGVMACEYVAASALGAIRLAAAPAGLLTASLSRGVEEDASFASHAAAATLAVAGQYRILLACELVAAARAVRLRPPPAASGPLAAAVRSCYSLPAGLPDRDLTGDIDRAVRLLPELAALVGG